MSHDQQFGRRKFLKNGVASIAGLSLTGLSLSHCASIDGIFTGEKILFDQEVLIVGGGISGLLCAHYLQQKGIPFVIIESNQRLGGRIASVRGLNANNDPIASELGPWFIRPSQKSVQDFFKSLQIPLTSQSLVIKHQHEVAQGNQWIEAWKKFNSRLSNQRNHLFSGSPQFLSYQNAFSFSELVAFDRLTANEWLASLNKHFSANFLSHVAGIIQAHFQANLDQVSALQVLVNLDFSFYQSLAERKSILVPQGGFQRGIDHLSSRLSGSVGAFRIKTNTKLIQIAERKSWFECQLQTQTDSRWVLAKRVIITAPAQALQQIKGIQELNLSERKKQFISQVQSVALKSSSRIQPSKTDNTTNLVIREKSIEWSSKDEQRQIAFADLASSGQAETWETSIDWSTRVGTLGGRINYRPGEYLTYLGAGSESAYDHRLCFAGDTTPASQFNDLEGAIASARMATEKILTTF